MSEIVTESGFGLGERTPILVVKIFRIFGQRMSQLHDTFVGRRVRGDLGRSGHELGDQDVQVLVGRWFELTILNEISHVFLHGVRQNFGLFLIEVEVGRISHGQDQPVRARPRRGCAACRGARARRSSNVGRH